MGDSDHYDYSMYQTYGGAAGTYLIRSPWNADCEVCIMQVSFQTAGAAFLSPQVNANINGSPPVLTSNQATDSVTSINPNNSLPGILWQSGLRQSYPMLEIWMPMGNATSYAFDVGAAAVAFLTVIYRRAKYLEHELPTALYVTNPDHAPQIHSAHEAVIKNVTRGRGQGL